MNISFQKTQDEFLQLEKFVTRRIWKPRTAAAFKKGSIHSALTNLPYCEDSRPLGALRALKDAYLEPLGEITLSELRAEGDKWKTPEDFFLEFVKDIERDLPNLEVYVARFVPVELWDARRMRPVPVRRTRAYCGKFCYLMRSYENFLEPVDDENLQKLEGQLDLLQTNDPWHPEAEAINDFEAKAGGALQWMENLTLRHFGVKCWLEYAAANQCQMPELNQHKRPPKNPMKW